MYFYKLPYTCEHVKIVYYTACMHRTTQNELTHAILC